MNEEEARARLRLIQIQKEKLALSAQPQPPVAAAPPTAPQEASTLDTVRGGLGQTLCAGHSLGLTMRLWALAVLEWKCSILVLGVKAPRAWVISTACTAMMSGQI